MAAPAVIFIATKLFMRHPIGMSGTWLCLLLFVIGAAGVVVFKQNSKRRTRGNAIEQTAFEQWRVVFATGRSATAATLAPLHVLLKITSRQWHSRRTTVYDNTHTLTVRFTQNMYAKDATEGVHVNWLIGFWFLVCDFSLSMF